MTNSAVDRLGERFRNGKLIAEDIEMLDRYRGLFAEPYDHVRRQIEREIGYVPSGRLKRAEAIVAKLRRESVRLSQMQDVAGCRIIVEDKIAQDKLIERLFDNFLLGAVSNFVDHRLQPRHGYRAVHVVVFDDESSDNRVVEIQIRTRIQNLWAQASERLADLIDPALKYGGGPDPYRKELLRASAIVADIERCDGIASEALRRRNLEKELMLTLAVDPKRGSDDDISSGV